MLQKLLLNKFKSIFVAILAITVLSACDDVSNGEKQCVMGDDFGNLVKALVEVSPAKEDWSDDVIKNNGWYDSGINVIADKPLYIRSMGRIDLCTENPVLVQRTFSPSPSNSGWQDSGVNVYKDRGVDIQVSGSYTSPDCDAANLPDDYTNKSCSSSYGMGLYAYIGGPPDAQWFGDDSQNGNDRMFFELWDRYGYIKKHNSNISGAISSNNTALLSQYSGYHAEESLFDGRLYFRYRDAEAGITSKDGPLNWGGSYNDNSGGYKLTISTQESCAGINGEYMLAFIGKRPPKNVQVQNNSTNPINLHNFAKSDNSVVPVRPAGVVNTKSPEGGKLWLKIIDDSTVDWNGDGRPRGDNDYKIYKNGKGSNSGSYIVSVVTVKNQEGAVNFINGIIDPVREFLFGKNGDSGFTEKAFKALVSNYMFSDIIRSVLVLALSFFGFRYMIGLSNISQTDLMYLVFKFGIIFTLVSPTAWEFFYENLFNMFINGVEVLIAATSNQINSVLDGSEVSISFAGSSYDVGLNNDPDAGVVKQTFGFISETVQTFFAKEVQIKIIGLLSTLPFGPIYASLIYLGMFYFLFAVVKSFMMFIISLIMVSLLLFISPIIFIFILFETTKNIFEKWIRLLVNYSIQPVMLFMVLAIFNVFIFSSFYMMLSHSVCWTCLFEIDFPFSEALKIDVDFDKLCLLYGYKLWGTDNGQPLAIKAGAFSAINLFLILIFVLIANIMLKTVDWVIRTANIIVSVGAGATVRPAAESMLAQTASVAKMGLRPLGHAYSGAYRVAKDASDSSLGRAIKRGGIKAGGAVSNSTGSIARGGKSFAGGKLDKFGRAIDDRKAPKIDPNKPSSYGDVDSKSGLDNQHSTISSHSQMGAAGGILSAAQRNSVAKAQADAEESQPLLGKGKEPDRSGSSVERQGIVRSNEFDDDGDDN